MRKILLACLGLVLAGLAPLSAADSAVDPAAAPAPIPLYDATAAPADAAPGEEIDEQLGGNHVLRNVTVPTLTPFLPVAGTGNGAAVIVAPGGGFMMLSIGYEGSEAARWLAAHGVAAFLLKYRLAHTPPNDALYGVLLAKTLLGVLHHEGPLPPLDGENDAATDGLQAVRLLRRRAAEWGVDPKRVGFLGFSAGAMTATHIAIEGDAASRPAFVGAIYGFRNPTPSLPADLPPLFMALAADDPLFAADAPGFCAAWRKSGASAELHLYERGGHGFGMHQQHLSSDHWIDEFLWWLDSRGLLTPAGH